MTQVTVSDPEMVVQKTVGNDGRIYLGTDLSGVEIEVVVSRKDDGGSDTVENAEAAQEVVEG